MRKLATWMLCAAVAPSAAAQTTLLDDGRWRIAGVAGGTPQIAVAVDGAPAGSFAALRFTWLGDASADDVLVLRGDGRIEPALPGGVPGGAASLGSYFDCAAGLVGPLRFAALELPARSKSGGRLELRGRLSNEDSLESEKLRLRIQPPNAERLRLELRYRLVATRELCIDRDRRDRDDVFRVVELAGSYLGPDAHTNDLARYVKDLSLDCGLFECDVDRETFCAPLENETGAVIDSPRRLRDRRLALFHTTDAPAPTPTLALEMRAPPPHQLRPQGFVTGSSDPAARNVAFWTDWAEVRGRYGAGRSLGKFRFVLAAERPRRPGCDRTQN